MQEEKGLILFANDIHCKVDRYPFLAAVKTAFINKGQEVLLVDGGDFSQGSMISEFYGRRSVVDLMNQTGFDVVTLGNHEFDHGVVFLKNLLKDLEAEVVTANLMDLTENRPVYAPYTIRTLCGHKIAFVGCTTPNPLPGDESRFFHGEADGHDYDLAGEGYDYSRVYELFQKAVDEARERGAQVVAGLVHVGNNAWPNMTSVELASRIRGVDIYLDAHDHRVRCDIGKDDVSDADGKKIRILETGTQLETVGHLWITWKNGSPKFKVEMVPIGQVEQLLGGSPFYQQKKSEMEQLLKFYLDGMGQLIEVIGSSPQQLGYQSDTCQGYHNSVARLLATVLKKETGAAVAFYGPESLKGGLPEGMLRRLDVMDMLPFNNEILIVPVKGKTLLKLLEAGCREYPKPVEEYLEGDNGLSYEVDKEKQGRFTTDEKGVLQYDPKAGSRIREVRIGGEALEEERLYDLALAEFTVTNTCRRILDADIQACRKVGKEQELFEHYVKNCPGRIVYLKETEDKVSE